MKTTLNQIRKHSPCINSWKKLLKHLNKTQADDEPLPIATIVASNGFDDALWCLKAVKGHDKEIRLYAVWCARQVQHLMSDKRSLSALDIAERFAHGQASNAELSDARKEAGDVEGALAGYAAWAADVAWAAAGNATWAATWTAARTAAWVAAGAAAWAAGWASGWAAGWEAAGDAAKAAAWDAQEQELLRFCAEIEAKLKEMNT